jgi:hypothetical protein
MSTAWDGLDPREKAVLIWSAILVIAVLLWAAKDKAIRSSVRAVARAFLVPPLSIIFALAVFYVAGVVIGAGALGIWSLALLGVTVLWCFGPAPRMFFNADRASKDPQFFATALRGTLSLTLLVEYAANLATFPLGFELFLVPAVSFLVVLAVVAESKPEFAPAKTALDYLFTVLAIVLLLHVALELASDFGSFWTFENLMRLVLPPALTIAFLPFMYFLRVYMRWDERCWDRSRRRLAVG